MIDYKTRSCNNFPIKFVVATSLNRKQVMGKEETETKYSFIRDSMNSLCFLTCCPGMQMHIHGHNFFTYYPI